MSEQTYSQVDINRLLTDSNRYGSRITREEAEALLDKHNGSAKEASNELYAKHKAQQIADVVERYEGLVSFVQLATQMATSDTMIAVCESSGAIMQAVENKVGSGGMVALTEWKRDGNHVYRYVRADAIFQIVAFEPAHHEGLAMESTRG